MATFTLAKLISDWELLNTALQPHLTDMPYLKDKVAALEGLITEAKEMDIKQQDLRGSLELAGNAFPQVGSGAADGGRQGLEQILDRVLAASEGQAVLQLSALMTTTR